MESATIAALVRAHAPDHAQHTQEFRSYDAIDRKVNVMCSCTVGLTIEVPAMAAQAPKPQPTSKQDKGGGHGA